MRTFIPVADGSICCDHEGHFFERIAIARHLDDNGQLLCECVDELGVIRGNPGYEAGFGIDTPKIFGKRGDTIRLNRLGKAYQVSPDVQNVIKEAKEFFTVDTSNLPTTVVLSFKLLDGTNASLNILTEEFPDLGGLVFDLARENEGYRSLLQCKYQSLHEFVIPMLAEYSEIIGQRVNLEIYIAKELYYDTEKEFLERHKFILELEDKYLPKLRTYINKGLDGLLKRIRMDESKRQDVFSMNSEWNRRYASKYDQDPTLMQ